MLEEINKLFGKESLKSWDKIGRNEFVKFCRDSVVKEAVACNSQAFSRVVYELFWHGISNKISEQNVIGTVSDIVSINPDVVSVVADVINVIELETTNTEDAKQRHAFLSIVNQLHTTIPDSILKERIEFDSLEDVGALSGNSSGLKSKKSFYTKFIKLKTKLYYKQHKFNLFREESEGYSKLITELFQEDVTPEYMVEVIKSLIGCFNLDPNRVLDVILESLECKAHNCDFYMKVLRLYMCDPKTIAEFLGFKFSVYNGLSSDSHQAGVTPESLYNVTSLLLQYECINLEDIYPWLLPSDDYMRSDFNNELNDAIDFVKKQKVVSTKGNQDELGEDEDFEKKLENNQKLGLCQALLRIGAWNQACLLMDRLPSYYAVSCPSISAELSHLIHVIIDPVYKRYSGLSSKIKKAEVLNHLSPLAPPQAQSISDLKQYAIPMLLYLGPHIYHDASLVYKVIRVFRTYLSEENPRRLVSLRSLKEDNLAFDVMTILDEVLLPALSLQSCNCCLAEELWGLLKLFPYHNRYYLYGLWKNVTYLQHPLLVRRKSQALKKIKFIMKRVSKESVKPTGRTLGKLSHATPGFLFDYVLSQIQIYDNLIGPVVDSLKYLSNLSYDMLGYCIIEALANPERDRMKHDGTSISLWLQSLSSFCGAVFKKYNIELTGLLQYVANQLKAEKSLDLLILKEIVQKMAGIEAAEEMTENQLNAMGGGELLKSEAGYFSQIRNTKKSSQRLKEALLEENLAVPLCLLMAQQRHCVLFQEAEQGHLKLVGKLYDQCQDTLVQFGSFLASNLSIDDYMRRLPNIKELLSDYHISADIAFFLSRPMLNHSITSKFDEYRRSDKNYKGLSSREKILRHCEIAEQVIHPVVEFVRPLHPAKTWEDLSPSFFVMFWSLTMYDLEVPSEGYEKEISKLKLQILQIGDNKDLATNKRRKEQDRCQTLIDKIQEEERKQKEHVERVLTRLSSDKDAWFPSRSAKNETITQFLQQCLFPRCIFTASDAVYCAKFVHCVHSLKTPNFSTLICIDRIFCDITYSVTSCTENEANRYGRFLCAMLEIIMKWHASKSVFDKECADYPGFMTKFRVANQHSEADHVDYENFRHVCHKWHYKITKALVMCLESGEYIEIRNALLVLIKILPHFPVIINLCAVIERRIEKVQVEEKEKRPDLYVLATSYKGQLKSRKIPLIPENEFHHKEQKVKAGVNVSVSGANPNSTAKDETATPSKESSFDSCRSAANELKHKLDGLASKTTRKDDLLRNFNNISTQLSPTSRTEAHLINSSGSGAPKDRISSDKDKKVREKKLDRSAREDSKKPKEERKSPKASSREPGEYDEISGDEETKPPIRTRSNTKEEKIRHHHGHHNREPSSSSDLDQSINNMSSSAISLASNLTGSLRRSSQEPQDNDRDVKRRKMDVSNSSTKGHRSEEKNERKKHKTIKRDKTEEEPTDRKLKERKLDKSDRKRDLSLDGKRRREEDSRVGEEREGRLNAHANGDLELSKEKIKLKDSPTSSHDRLRNKEVEKEVKDRKRRSIEIKKR